jgi:hypothetical protein
MGEMNEPMEENREPRITAVDINQDKVQWHIGPQLWEI